MASGNLNMSVRLVIAILQRRVAALLKEKNYERATGYETCISMLQYALIGSDDCIKEFGYEYGYTDGEENADD